MLFGFSTKACPTLQFPCGFHGLLRLFRTSILSLREKQWNSELCCATANSSHHLNFAGYAHSQSDYYYY